MAMLYSLVDGPRPFSVHQGLIITEELSAESKELLIPIDVTGDYVSLPVAYEDLHDYGCLAVAYNEHEGKAFCLHRSGLYNEFSIPDWKLLTVGHVDLPPTEQTLVPLGCFYYGREPFLVLFDRARNIGYISSDMFTQHKFRFYSESLRAVTTFDESFCLYRARSTAVAICGDILHPWTLQPYTWEVKPI